MNKTESTTFLCASHLVDKTHSRITFRGLLDSLNGALVALQVQTEREGRGDLLEDLEAIRLKVCELLLCEVTGRACGDLELWGLNSDEIRLRSHNPADYFGLGHVQVHYSMGSVAAALNVLRTKVRETELCACRAFATPDGVEREDIIRVLNRMSSALYILMYKHLPQGYDKTVF